MTNFGELRYLARGGGIRIFYQSQFIGAAVVSGLPDAQDMALTRAAADLPNT